MSAGVPARAAYSPHTSEHPDAGSLVRRRYAARHPGPEARQDQVVTHLEHLREVAGVDHIGIGGDYDGVPHLPIGLEDVSGYPRLFAALADRGWSDEDMVKLAGANVLRVLGEAEVVARELQAARGPSLATIEQLDGRAGAPVPR